MTETTSPPTPLGPLVIAPPPDSRLGQLMAQLEPTKKAKADAEAAEKALTEAIKAEASKLARTPEEPVILRSPHAEKAWQFGPRTVRRLNSKGLRKALPELWNTWAPESVEWRLDPLD